MKTQFEHLEANTTTEDNRLCRARWMVNLARTANYTTQTELAKAMGVVKTRVSHLKKRAITLGLLRQGELEMLLATAIMQRGQQLERGGVR